MRRALLLMALAAGCHDASPDPGSQALLIVAGAQYVPGDMPVSGNGPEVIQIFSTHSAVVAGGVAERIKGALAPRSTGVAIGLRGDAGYWLLTAGVPEVETPELPSFDLRASFARRLAPGPIELEVRAIDVRGIFGPPSVLGIEAQAPASATGELVFALTWQRDVDLDIRVVLPNGIEVWRENVSSYTPPPVGQPEPDPEAPLRAGILDAESNSNCRIDGRRNENVIFARPDFPRGRYLVRVDTFSMCNQSASSWLVEVRAHGERIGAAHGVAREADTRHPHGPGAGLTALEVDVP